MNLLITTTCNLACPYCFAASLGKQHPAREMSLSEIEQAVVGLDLEKDAVRLMGGEPTLHSSYAEILRWLKDRGYRVVVFSNGIHQALRQTDPWLPDRVLLNVNARGFYSHDQRRQIRENLSALAGRVELGYTISSPDFDLSWHRKLVLEEGCLPMIRIGLAQPVIGGDNVYLADEDLPEAHAAVVGWAKKLAADGIQLSMDCGFMRCMFNDQQVEDLIRAGTGLRFECSPVVDLGPGLAAWRCYAFSNQPGIHWSDFKDETACQAWFTAMDRCLPPGCTNCQYLANGGCQGGCRARALLALNNAARTPA